MKTLIIFILLTAANSYASFTGNQVRYMNAWDLLNVFNQKFPSAKQNVPSTAAGRCVTLNTFNSTALGVSSPQLQKPLNAKPNPAFIRWMNDCLSEYLKLEIPAEGKLRNQFADDYFPATLIKKYELRNSEKLKAFLYTFSWSKLTTTEQEELILHLSTWLVGPPKVFGAGHELKRFTDATIKIVDELVSKEDNMSKYLAAAVSSIAQRDEFLRY